MTEQTDKTTIRPDTSDYVTTRAASGAKSQHNGSPVAIALEGLTVDEVKEVAEAMGVENPNKYDHLNPGQVRMNLGNRIRGRITVFDNEKAALEAKAEGEFEKASEKKAAEREAKAAQTGEEALAEACKGPHKEREARQKERKAEAERKAREKAAKEKAAKDKAA